MFLFNKKTRNVVKWFWGVFATLIIISMVVTYSGFTMLPGPSGGDTSVELTPEQLAALREAAAAANQATTTSMGGTSTDMATGTEAVTTPTPVEDTPPVPELRFDI